MYHMHVFEGKCFSMKYVEVIPYLSGARPDYQKEAQ